MAFPRCPDAQKPRSGRRRFRPPPGGKPACFPAGRDTYFWTFIAKRQAKKEE